MSTLRDEWSDAIVAEVRAAIAPPPGRFEDHEVLALPGVLHLLRGVRTRDGEVSLEAWSPDVLNGLSATCALSLGDRRRLVEFLMEGL